MKTESNRLNVVDALRGFAIVSILLLHHIQHFYVNYTPECVPDRIATLDIIICNILNTLFSGKAYAIFALLFGLTFYIQENNQKKRNRDFTGRFVWRLLILLLIGLFNTLFYSGDIIAVYAVLGLILIPASRLNNKVIILIGLFLMAQPFELANIVKAINNTDLKISDPASWTYYKGMYDYICDGSLLKLWVGNILTGKIAALYFTWESGRLLQTAALFLFGYILGRKRLFVISPRSNRFWVKVLVSALALLVLLLLIRNRIDDVIHSNAISYYLRNIVTSWSHFLFMLIQVSFFVMLYQVKFFQVILNIFSPIGRMSLSNYVFQSIVGSFIYYGYGLSLYKYTGATYCFLIGIIMAILQWYLSSLWLKKHKRGPLETLWHKATWIGDVK